MNDRIKRILRTAILIVFASLVLVFAIQISAQDGDSVSNDLPEPDPNMRDMSWFIGEWDVVSRTLVDFENEEWLEETLRTVHTYELGGHIIFENFIGPVGGEPFEAWSIRKYNPNTERWEQRWVDTSPSGFADWSGTWDAEANQFVGYAMTWLDEEFNLASDFGSREVFDNITEDSFSWRFEGTRTGGEMWRTTWTLEYTRVDSE